MTIEGYETKVPENVQAQNTEKLAGYDTELEETNKQLALFQNM